MITAVRFHADWCTPCKQYEPVFRQFAEAKHLVATDVDIEQYPQTKDSFQIRTVPTTVGLVNGEEVFRLTGVQTTTHLEDAFEPYL